MKKLTLVFVSLAMTLLLGCSRDEPEESQKAPETVKTQVKPKDGRKIPNENEEKVVCNKFNLVTKVTGSTLNLSVDTDLPDHTVVMVSVSRSYLEKGNPARYPVDYFSERGNIGKWKSKHRISIASEKWESALRAKQEEMSRVGLGFNVASISKKIDVSMVVPINQPDPRFGERNSKLTGKAVIMASKGGRTITGKVVGPMYVVKDEIEIDYPLDSPPVGRSPFPSLNPLELENGQAYIVSKQTPLMPSPNPADPMAAIQQIKQIPEGGVFKLLETFKEGNTPWYKVIAFDQMKKQMGTGWINSTALLGQQLKAEVREPSEDLTRTVQSTEAPSYKIINEDILPGIKRSLDVRLNKKVSGETLRTIALKLKAQNSRNYERTFICYYLPNMEVGAGAWATTHFDPDLEVRILGLTAEQEEALKKQPNDPSREVIGSWLDESPYLGCKVTIFRQNGKLFMENTYKDGSSSKKEIVEKLSRSLSE